MASSTLSRAAELPLDKDGFFADFGFLIDTHRDLPHIGSFDDDLHRGMCRPTKVDLYMRAGSPPRIFTKDRKASLEVHSKHMFVTEEWYRQFIIDYMKLGGVPPFDGDGRIETKLLRDPRKGVYHLQSFRQMVVHHQRRLGIYAPR